ncbi:four helix bundle protein [Rhodohalobacter sp. 8-1]|uniref:four helix bundle protein n=1 Tax=Rhodohalobacter sp. 8-1 TaxID=3131972 RepID=UPI0030EF89EA
MRIRSHRELDVYQMSFNASMNLFELSKSFPREEQYSLTDQVRRSSRSVAVNISEAFRKRKYPEPGLFTKKFYCEQGVVEKATEGYHWYLE